MIWIFAIPIAAILGFVILVMTDSPSSKRTVKVLDLSHIDKDSPPKMRIMMRMKGTGLIAGEIVGHRRFIKMYERGGIFKKPEEQVLERDEYLPLGEGWALYGVSRIAGELKRKVEELTDDVEVMEQKLSISKSIIDQAESEGYKVTSEQKRLLFNGERK